MTDDELDRLAAKIAEKMQINVLDSIYKDAGKTAFGMFKNVFWGVVLFLAAWGASMHWGDAK